MTEGPLYACAGCQNPYPVSNLIKRGLVRPKQYCETCVVEIDRLLELRDQLHTEAAQELQDNLLQQVRFFQLKHPGFGLPDA